MFLLVSALLLGSSHIGVVSFLVFLPVLFCFPFLLAPRSFSEARTYAFSAGLPFAFRALCLPLLEIFCQSLLFSRAASSCTSSGFPHVFCMMGSYSLSCSCSCSLSFCGAASGPAFFFFGSLRPSATNSPFSVTSRSWMFLLRAASRLPWSL